MHEANKKTLYRKHDCNKIFAAAYTILTFYTEDIPKISWKNAENETEGPLLENY